MIERGPIGNRGPPATLSSPFCRRSRREPDAGVRPADMVDHRPFRARHADADTGDHPDGSTRGSVGPVPACAWLPASRQPRVGTNAAQPCGSACRFGTEPARWPCRAGTLCTFAGTVRATFRSRRIGTRATGRLHNRFLRGTDHFLFDLRIHREEYSEIFDGRRTSRCFHQPGQHRHSGSDDRRTCWPDPDRLGATPWGKRSDRPPIAPGVRSPSEVEPRITTPRR
jgi:hypothetical protein